MLAWISKKFAGNEEDAPVEMGVLETYDALLEKYRNYILDEKSLPLPRAEMKALLSTGCKAAQTPEEVREAGLRFVSLAFFQPGVGDTPIDDKIPDDPEEIIAKFTPAYVALQKKVNADIALLRKEIENP